MRNFEKWLQLRQPGRPSHSYHTYLMAGRVWSLASKSKPATNNSGSHSLPGLLQVLDDLPPNRRPKIMRGDGGFGSDTLMRPLEERQQRYPFKLRLSKNVKRLIERLFRESDWTDAGQGWEGTLTLTELHAHFDKASQVLMRVSAQLQGWAKEIAEQLLDGTVWHCVCDHLKLTLAAIGPPKSVIASDKSSVNCGFRFIGSPSG